MSALFFSFLGTGKYIECNYFLDDKKVENVKFVQTASFKFSREILEEEPRCLIAVTRDAKEKNSDALKSEFEEHGLPIPHEMDIPDGSDNEGLWEIFRRISKAVKDKDRIVFDVTHSFRSLPVIATILMQYLRVVKNVSIEAIYYGAFEKLGPPQSAKGLPVEQRNVPVFNLTPFVSVYDWAQAVDNFISFGSLKQMKSLVHADLTPVLKASQGTDHNAKSIREIFNILESFTEAASSCRGGEICNGIKFSKAVENIETLENSLIPSLEPLLEKIKLLLSRFRDKDIHNGINSAEWCAEHGMVQQAYTILQECLISRYEQYFKEIKDTKERRSFISSFLNYANGPRQNWEHELKKYETLALGFREKHCIPDALFKSFRNISNARNDINHAGFLENSMKTGKLKDSLKHHIDEIKNILADIDNNGI